MAASSDGIYNKFEEYTSTAIDGLNFVRNLGNASGTICSLSGAVGAAALSGLQAANSSLLLGCGMLYLGISKGIPEAREKREKAHAKYIEIIQKSQTTQIQETTEKAPSEEASENASLIKKAPAVQKSSLQKLLYNACEIIASMLFAGPIFAYIASRLNFECKDDPNNPQAIIAQKRVKMAILNEYSWALMVRTGFLQIATGVVTFLSQGPMASFLHYSGCIALNTGMLIGTVLGSALGITYFVRGIAVIYRARENRQMARDLRAEIKAIYESNELIKEKKEKIKKALEKYCHIHDGSIDFLDSFTKTHIESQKISADQTKIDRLDKINEETDLYHFIKILDQGLHKEIVSFEIAESLGYAMILGGVFSVIAVATTGGLAAPITALISAFVFMYLEGTFALYDTTKWFNNYQNELYKQPGWLLDPAQTLIQTEETKEDASSSGIAYNTLTSFWWYASRILTAPPRIIHYLYEQNEASIAQSNKLLSTQTGS